MTMTVRAVVDALDRDSGRRRRARRSSWAHAATRASSSRSSCAASFRGAARGRRPRRRGRGARPAGASDAGYAAVRNPQEGTILTRRPRAGGTGRGARRPRQVHRGCAWRRSSPTARRPSRARPSSWTSSSRQGSSMRGGAGLLEIVRGVAAHVRGEALPEPAPLLERDPDSRPSIRSCRAFRYCTSFFVEGDAVDPDSLEAELLKLGDSLLVVGSAGRGQGARAHGRARRGARAGDLRRGARGGGDEEHARPDGRARRAAPGGRGPAALGRRRRRLPAPGRGGCSRAWARLSSRAGSR